jgi:hypothetical protein
MPSTPFGRKFLLLFSCMSQFRYSLHIPYLQCQVVVSIGFSFELSEFLLIYSSNLATQGGFLPDCAIAQFPVAYLLQRRLPHLPHVSERFRKRVSPIGIEFAHSPRLCRWRNFV